MDDPVAAERAKLRDDVALLRRLRASMQPDDIAVQAVEAVTRERHAQLDELEHHEPAG